MQSRTVSTFVVAALGLVAAGLASAQTTTTTRTAPTTDTWRMPYQSGFWGHAGLSVGQSKLDDGCIRGFDCDDKDQAFRVYAGGRFNNAVGLELGVMNPGRFARGEGRTDGWGADVALVAGIPIGANSAIFGKLGFIYARTEVDGDAPGLDTGKERGFGPRWGIGGQVGLTPQWAVRADWDRFRFAFPGSKEDIDTLMLGVQYTFR
jgi:hypothetical protein